MPAPKTRYTAGSCGTARFGWHDSRHASLNFVIRADFLRCRFPREGAFGRTRSAREEGRARRPEAYLRPDTWVLCATTAAVAALMTVARITAPLRFCFHARSMK